MGVRWKVFIAAVAAMVFAAAPVVASGAEIALRFQWDSTKDSAGYLHNVRQYAGGSPGSWADLSNPPTIGSGRFNEDRLSIMIDDPANPVPNFSKYGCYLSCHDNMNHMPNKTAPGNVRHYFRTTSAETSGTYAMDMWHWRGGRSGPSGYADDTYVRFHTKEANTNSEGRQRDGGNADPDDWATSLTWDQDYNVDYAGRRLPQFVFNPAKSEMGTFFLSAVVSDETTTVNNVAQLWALRDPQYRPQAVVFQDYDFDPVDKVNAIDVRYLVWRAGLGPSPFAGEKHERWQAFWSAQLPGVVGAQDALGLLDAVVAELEASLDSGTNKGPMMTRTVAAIFESAAHDISSAHSIEYTPDGAKWTLTLYRDLDTGDAKDVDLTALRNKALYHLGIGIHDINDDANTHHVTPAISLGLNAGDIKAREVEDVRALDWSAVPTFTVEAFQPGTTSYETISSRPFGHGAAVLNNTTCGVGEFACHARPEKRLHEITSSTFAYRHRGANQVNGFTDAPIGLTVQAVVTKAPVATRMVISSADATLAKYGASYSLRGRLVTQDGAPVAGQQVRLQSSASTSGFKNTSRTATTTADGSFSFSVTPRDRTYYRVTYAGVGLDWAAADPSAVRRVTPRAFVSAPVVPTTMYRGRAKAVYGDLKPRHVAGTTPVTLQIQRKSGSKWVKHATVKASVSNHKELSRYKRSVTFTRAGQYRIRATHPADPLHAAHTSAWRTITVR